MKLEGSRTSLLVALLTAACSGTDRGAPAASGGTTSQGESGGTASGGNRTSSSGGTTNGESSSGGRSAAGANGALGGANGSAGRGAMSNGGAMSGGGASSGGTAESGGRANAGEGGRPMDGRSSGGRRSAGGSSSSGGASAGSEANAGRTGVSGSAGLGGSTAVGGGASTAGAGGAGAPSCTGSDPAYRLVWSDEFDGPLGAAVDATHWVFDVGGTGGGNNELEYYSDGTNNAALDGDGHLVITARRETHGNNDYTSARIKTLGKASWTFGRVEARIKIPKGQGIWPAFWMLGSSCTGYPVSGWPDCGEIDVMENIGKAADQNLVHGTLHGPGYSAAAGPTQTVTLTSPVSADYHVFAIEWQKDRIDWYVDSSLYSTKTPDDIPSTAKWVYNAPFYVLLNVAVGGDWPGAPDGTTVFPQEMIVDYVRVCQKP